MARIYVTRPGWVKKDHICKQKLSLHVHGHTSYLIKEISRDLSILFNLHSVIFNYENSYIKTYNAARYALGVLTKYVYKRHCSFFFTVAESLNVIWIMYHCLGPVFPHDWAVIFSKKSALENEITFSQIAPNSYFFINRSYSSAFVVHFIT